MTPLGYGRLNLKCIEQRGILSLFLCLLMLRKVRAEIVTKVYVDCVSPDTLRIIKEHSR